MRLRAAFAGTPPFALPSLAALRAHHEVVGVLTRPDRPSGRGRQLSASAVKRAALEAHLRLAQPATLRTPEAQALIAAWRPEVLVVVAYGLMLPPEVLALPRFGCLNVHASLLPRWRGAAPIQRAILAGDAQTGVSIMQMDSGLDTGPVLLERRIDLRRDDTSGSLHERLGALGAEALLTVLEGLAAGQLHPAAQPPQGATYAPKIAKVETRIDWSRPAIEIERQVRAFNPYPVAETRLEGEQLRIFAADAKPQEGAAKSVEHGTIIGIIDGNMLVQCGAGILAVKEVQRPGRRPVSARDFAHARQLTGQRLG